MKMTAGPLTLVLLLMSIACLAQTSPELQKATPAVLHAFQSHEIVMLGEVHGNKQEYDWLRSLVANRGFAELVDDVVIEFGNSRYQQVVDQYVRGDAIPIEQVQGAWLDTVAAVGPPSPVYASLYEAVRETNMKRKGKHQIRILCGDSNIDWSRVNEGKDIVPYLSTREQSYVQVVESEVIAKHHRALLIMGAFHFLRHFDMNPGRKQFDIEQQIRTAGANPYLIVTGTNTTGSARLDQRFDSWPNPVIVALQDNWVGELPAIPVVTEGHGPALALKLKDAADALLYLGPKDSLITVQMSPVELEGTPYGKELERREKLQMSLEK
ncbi:MAG: hypothetical protein QOH35_43 [Acidobacteriaceae bacterium]|jgi:hypothetical protein|nr:hypothetical protein [Acidobacteriaceae bacterium]MEA2538677.1 hypothetical protein [Acidobacteriaceae bacterium]